MPAALRIRLAPEEDYTLSQLQIAALVPQRTRKRAHMLRLNAQGWAVGAIAEIFECHEHTVRATIRRWRQQGVGGLWEAPGRGAMTIANAMMRCWDLRKTLEVKNRGS